MRVDSQAPLGSSKFNRALGRLLFGSRWLTYTNRAVFLVLILIRNNQQIRLIQLLGLIKRKEVPNLVMPLNPQPGGLNLLYSSSRLLLKLKNHQNQKNPKIGLT